MKVQLLAFALAVTVFGVSDASAGKSENIQHDRALAQRELSGLLAQVKSAEELGSYLRSRPGKSSPLGTLSPGGSEAICE